MQKFENSPKHTVFQKNIPQHLSIHSRLLLQNTSTFTTRRKSDSVQNVHSLIACTCYCLAVIWTMYLLIEFSSFNMATVHSLWQRCVHMAIYGKSDLHSYSSVHYSVFPTLHKLSVKFHLQQCSNSGGYHENCMQKNWRSITVEPKSKLLLGPRNDAPDVYETKCTETQVYSLYCTRCCSCFKPCEWMPNPSRSQLRQQQDLMETAEWHTIPLPVSR